ncbi:MAG: hypothetical protein KAG14_02845 [Mycoplasmataceae bacterium]|nr:hypothetical protein [Mycoplasmataceae bacterium]
MAKKISLQSIRDLVVDHIQINDDFQWEIKATNNKFKVSSGFEQYIADFELISSLLIVELISKNTDGSAKFDFLPQLKALTLIKPVTIESFIRNSKDTMIQKLERGTSGIKNVDKKYLFEVIGYTHTESWIIKFSKLNIKNQGTFLDKIAISVDVNNEENTICLLMIDYKH